MLTRGKKRRPALQLQAIRCAALCSAISDCETAAGKQLSETAVDNVALVSSDKNSRKKYKK